MHPKNKHSFLFQKESIIFLYVLKLYILITKKPKTTGILNKSILYIYKISFKFLCVDLLLTENYSSTYFIDLILDIQSL